MRPRFFESWILWMKHSVIFAIASSPGAEISPYLSMPTASWLICFVDSFVQHSIFHSMFLCNACLALLLLIRQQLKPSGFDCAPSILYCVTLSTLRLTDPRVAPWGFFPLSSASSWWRVSHDGLSSSLSAGIGLRISWSRRVDLERPYKEHWKMQGKGSSCSILNSSSPVSGDAWTSRQKSRISTPCRTQCLSYEHMPDLHGTSLKLSQKWKAAYAWVQLDSCLLAIHKANWRASNCCLCIQAIVFEFYWLPNDVSSLTSVSFDK